MTQIRNPEEGSGGGYAIPVQNPVAVRLLNAELERAEVDHFSDEVGASCSGCVYAAQVKAERDRLLRIV